MDDGGGDGRLELPREAMRALGYRVVDLLVERTATLAERASGTRSTGAIRVASHFAFLAFHNSASAFSRCRRT